MPRLQLSQGSLYFETFGEKGEGNTLFVFSGIGLSGKFYYDVSNDLAKLGYFVVCPDHRRLGRSTAPLPWNFSIFDIAADAVAIADHLGVKNFHVVGESYGGMVALATAIRHEQRVLSLTVINSSIGSHRFRLHPRAFLKIAHGWMVPYLWLTNVSLNVFSPEGLKANPAIKTRWEELLAEDGFPVTTTNKQTIAALKFYVGRSLRRIKVASLVIYGALDTLVPIANSKLIARLIPQAELHIVSNGGHHLCGERPVEISNILNLFIKKIKKT